jgi:hypothetical protein
MTPSKYQEAIFEHQDTGTGNAFVSAVAGSGKSTTLRLLAERLPQQQRRRAIFTAFNKHIAEELKTKLPEEVQCQTIHGIGMGILRRHFGSVSQEWVNGNKYEKLVRIWATRKGLRPFTADMREIENFLGDVTRLCMLTLTDLTSTDAICDLVQHFGMIIPPAFWGLAADQLDIPVYQIPESEIYGWIRQIVKQLLDWGLRGAPEADKYGCKFSAEECISFDDMVYLPHALEQIQVPVYETVYVDECLPYKVPVHLADGSSMMIGDIVEQKLPVEVLGYDTQTHEQRVCRVIGWSKTPNRKPLVKIKAKWHNNGQTTTNFVVCTIDHAIWANGTWMLAEFVKPGMTVQVESAALKSQAYKITTSGRQTLSVGMAIKNTTPAMRNSKNNAKISQRGGNGRGATVPQKVLLDALGDDWTEEYAIPTYMSKGMGYPTCYKVDIANPIRRIAVEVDGGSHNSPARRAQDAKKDALLVAHGWRVYRVPNMRAMKDTDTVVREVTACIGTDCPTDAIVVSVESIDIPEFFVYDITVEDCHNFYANGILVHNCQDLNAAQRELVIKLKAPNGRMTFVGDEKQAIMGFAGADATSVKVIADKTQAARLPLSICYRCPKSHLDMAREIVPEIEHAEHAEDGEVLHLDPDDLHTTLRQGDMVLCRTNAPLISTCFQLIARGVPAKVRGRDIGKGLTFLVESVEDVKGYTWDEFGKCLAEYEAKTIAKLSDKEGTGSQIQGLQDRAESVRLIQSQTHAKGQCRDAKELKVYINSLFTDSGSVIELSSVHKAKGLEADRVFILRPELLPHPRLNFRWQGEQEMNLKYVALTRAKQTLGFVQEEL